MIDRAKLYKICEEDLLSRFAHRNNLSPLVCAALNYFMDKMNAVPAVDAVEVCRCKECIYSNFCDIEWMLLGDGVENPYCAAGERREENA